jgi:hypothetical protein
VTLERMAEYMYVDLWSIVCELVVLMDGFGGSLGRFFDDV